MMNSTCFSAIPSKSMAHRLLLGAYLAGAPDLVVCDFSSKDIDATRACLLAMDKGTLLPCGESGSTLRFLLPVAAALGKTCTFFLEGRLPQRPLHPLDRELEAHGCRLTRPGAGLLTIAGRLQPGNYTLPGNISSQFITGLLFALPLLKEESTLEITGTLESRPYVDLTLDALRQFGVKIQENGPVFTVKPSKFQRSAPVTVEGDWSNAAFWLTAGAISKPVTVTGLNPESLQGDREIFELLGKFGAVCHREGGAFTVAPAPLHGLDIDAAGIPDLVPILAVAAACAQGDTRICNARRLRLKESDRIQSVCAMLRSIGAGVEETEDGLLVHGGQPLTGGTVDSFGDHRIAMAAAIAGLKCKVEIIGKNAVEKSYPGFWAEYTKLTIDN